MRGGAARRISIVISGALVAVALLGGVAAAQVPGPPPEGITFDPGAATGGPGASDALVALFALVVLGSIGATIWKVAAARGMAREAGLDPARATAVTLLDEDGLSATYLASSLRRPAADPPSPAGSWSDAASASQPVAERLRTLDQLRDEGLITVDEHAARRAAILDEV